MRFHSPGATKTTFSSPRGFSTKVCALARTSQVKPYRSVQKREHGFHPIREYLESLTWDGVRRIDVWLTKYLGANFTTYTRAVGTRCLISAVARVFRPGCKVDTCLILEGPQGALKSTALHVLAGDAFFSDDISELGSKRLGLTDSWSVDAHRARRTRRNV